MQVLTEVLENELKNAVEVKDESALHRYVSMMVEQKNQDEKHEKEHELFKEAVLKMDTKTDAILIEMREGFKRMDERFEAVDKRFEAVDKRFEAVDKRFEAVDKRFDEVNKRFEAVDKRFDEVNKRFEAVDKRFDDANKRFESVDKRFDDMNKRFTMMFSFITIGFVMLGTIMTVIQLFG